MNPMRLRDAPVRVNARVFVSVCLNYPRSTASNEVNLLPLSLFLSAYERTHPVYRSKRTPDAPVHLVVGGAGNHEGHAGERMETAGITLYPREKGKVGMWNDSSTPHSSF